MLKVTIYDGPLGMEVSYMEGVTEPGGKRKVETIDANEGLVIINFANEHKEFYGFRYIIDSINEKSPKKRK